MTHESEPSYQELKRRLEKAESALKALREGEVDTIVGDRENLVVRLAAAEAREAHIKEVLQAVRAVNRLIVHESDPQRLIEGTCTSLTETVGYRNAWIALLDDSGKAVKTTASSGFGSGFAVLEESLKRGDLPACMERALSQEECVAIEDPAAECTACPLIFEYNGRAGLVRRLAYGDDRVYGILCASVPAHYVHDAEEQDLFNELADNLALGFRRIEESRALVESERKFRDILDNASDAVFIHDMEGRFLEVNEAACKSLGYTREEFLRLAPEHLNTEEYSPLIKDRIKAIEHKGQLVFETAYRRKDGLELPVEVNSRRIEYTGTTCVLSVARDITERKRAEEERDRLQEQLRQSQKMEAIGSLAGGVAHDFNNILTTIMGNAEIVLMDLSREEPLYNAIEEIREAGERASGLTRQLLAFSRRQILQPEVLNLNDLLPAMDKMLRRIIGEDIELETLLGADLGLVEADPGQMEQIIMNLAVNARDAMPEGGTLTIETANVDLDEAYSESHGRLLDPGPYVMLAVSDTGVGMSPETRAQVFDPFFTTKEEGKGTGLGLSTVYGTVKQSNGYIWVYSEPGQGTSFKIYLPRVEKEIRGGEGKRPKAEDLHGSETILVVEDDEAVRGIAFQSLIRYGYTVLTAPDGEEALRILNEHLGGIHLVLTDVVMPGMSGKEAAKQLKELEPAVEVLYMSGYTDNAIVHHGVLDQGVNFIQKPFTPEDLVSKIREMLDS